MEIKVQKEVIQMMILTDKYLNNLLDQMRTLLDTSVPRVNIKKDTGEVEVTYTNFTILEDLKKKFEVHATGVLKEHVEKKWK